MIEWLVRHYVELIAILGSIHGTASLITALTPTPKDDEVLRKYYRVIEVLGGVIGRAKES